jgi:hypothetical protein
MSRAPSDERSTDERRRGWLGPLPVWAWIVLTIALVIALLLLGVALFGGGPDDDPLAADPTPTTGTSTSSSPAPTPNSTVTPTPGGDVGQGTFASEMDSYLSAVLFSQNTAVLSEGGTFSDPIFVLAANSGLTQNMTPDEAVDAMAFMFTPVDPNPWDLALPASTIDGYRAGPYGAYFPVGAIVARSYDGHVFSFIGNGSTITTMFMAASEDLLTTP